MGLSQKNRIDAKRIPYEKDTHCLQFLRIFRKGSLLRNREIRNKLLGFLLKMLPLPNYWNFSMSGLTLICKEDRTAVHNAVGKLMDMGYLVRTKLLPNESIHNCFEYVYSFFDKPVSKEEANELEAETRRKAITVREGGRAKIADLSSVEKQEVENLYLDSPPSEIHRLKIRDNIIQKIQYKKIHYRVINPPSLLLRQSGKFSETPLLKNQAME